jgi:hypothetical protein
MRIGRFLLGTFIFYYRLSHTKSQALQGPKIEILPFSLCVLPSKLEAFFILLPESRDLIFYLLPGEIHLYS